MRESQRGTEIVDCAGLPVIVRENRNARLIVRGKRAEDTCDDFRLLRPAHHVGIHLRQFPARLFFHPYSVYIPEFRVRRGRIEGKNRESKRRSDHPTENERGKDRHFDPISAGTADPRFHGDCSSREQHRIDWSQVVDPPAEDQEFGKKEKIRPNKKAERLALPAEQEKPKSDKPNRRRHRVEEEGLLGDKLEPGHMLILDAIGVLKNLYGWPMISDLPHEIRNKNQK